jgi:hypothetical protein
MNNCEWSLKNLLRYSKNKQRKEKTQTMKKNFILLLLDLFIAEYYFLRILNASSSLCKTTLVLFSLLFLNFLLF